jgi:predicted nucleic acid-binding protein
VIVVDASAVLEVLLNPKRATEIAQYLFAQGESIHVPHLIDLEVLQTLRRYARSAEVGMLRAEQALQIFADMRLNRYSHAVLAPRIWELRHNWTAYDAAYIALAEALDAPLNPRSRAGFKPGTPGPRARVLVQH